MINYGERLIVNKSNYRSAVISKGTAPETGHIAEGQVIIQLEKFAYTSNNTTYAVVGDLVGYWKFFPVPEEGLGIIPCWGFGVITASKNNEIKVGSRYYGYFPMGSHLVVNPGHISKRGFTDIVQHRRELPVIYNQYVDCATDPLYRPELEEMQCLFRPLFTTSFLIHDLFKQNDFFNSAQIILTSASSKTALGLASLLAEEDVRVVGLTSIRNVEMVEATGYYDSVIAYDYVSSIDQIASSIVDFAGNHDVMFRIQQQCSEQLNYVCLVGMVHWEEREGQQKLLKKGSFFFAPTYAAERIKEIGHPAFNQNLARAYFKFVGDARNWIDIKMHKGGEALNALHQKMTDGDIAARDGHIVKF